VFALTIALGASGAWNIDMSRAAREDRPPQEYLGLSYYQLWLAGIERLLAEHTPQRVLQAGDVAATLARGGPASRPAPRAAGFAVGDRVRTRNLHPHTHTRLPRYARDKTGTVELVHGCHVFPDRNVFRDEDPQWLYTVRFSARELWGRDDAASVSVDAFEPYLERA
jgi:nitrile hydratase